MTRRAGPSGFLAAGLALTLVLGFIGINRAFAAAAATYYVSPSGSDANNGLSPQTAWKTIARANLAVFGPGQSLMLQGGSTFSGQLYFGPGESGTAASPITVGSYGNGVATISAGTANAIYAYDAGGFQISNLDLVGSGAATSRGSGINFYSDLSSGSLAHVYVSNVTASGFLNGLLLGGSGSAGFGDVNVTRSVFHDNTLAGLQTYGPAFDPAAPTYANTGVYIGYVTAYNNLGNAALKTSDSGSGIVLGSAQDATVERSIAYNNGGSCVASACGVGIWAYDSDNVTIQYNESYGNHTASKVDGDGFDLDQNTSNSVMQYNYSHDNDGAGYLLYALSTDMSHRADTVRFNISQNDGRKNSYGSILLYGPVSGDAIYNNTAYVSPSRYGGTPTDIKILALGSGTAAVRNNILYAAGGLYPVVVTSTPAASALQFQQNDYFDFAAYWGSSTYKTLASWRSATGQEMLNGQPIGATVNPQLADAGGGGTIADADDLALLTQYELASGSPARDDGLNLGALFGVSIGSHDYFGTTVPGPGGLSIGAAE